MNALLSLTDSLSLAILLLAAPAQSPLPKVTAKPVNTTDPAATARKTADRRAATYKGPKVVKSTEALGQKMLHDSKPAPASVPVAPTKQ